MEKSVKNSVIESYSKLAKISNSTFNKLFACCDLSDNANQVGKVIGYSEKNLNNVPNGSNLGVGCGNPSAHIQIEEGDKIIDLGSGAGFDAFIVSELVGSTGKIIGIDLSEDMLSLARKNAKKGNYANVEFIKGDIEKLPLENNFAQFIISNCVINLSLNKTEVFKEAYRVLDKNGILAISDIVLKQDLPDWIKNSLPGHIACVSGAEKIDQYIDYIKAAGFKDISIVSEKQFPLELMLNDPQVMKLAQEMNFSLQSDEARDIASRVSSITVLAKK